MLLKSKSSTRPTSDAARAALARAEPVRPEALHVDPLLPIDLLAPGEGIWPVASDGPGRGFDDAHGGALLGWVADVAAVPFTNATQWTGCASRASSACRYMTEHGSGGWLGSRAAKRIARARIRDDGRPASTSRAARGLSLRRLAEVLGVSPSLISQVETGRAKPSVNTLYALATELGISLDTLLFMDTEPPSRQAADRARRARSSRRCCRTIPCSEQRHGPASGSARVSCGSASRANRSGTSTSSM